MIRRPARPPRGDRSRHARYDVEVDALGGAGFLRCREHDLIDLGRRLPSLDGVTCDTYGYALLHYGYHLGLLERLAGLHRDLVRATARDLARTLGLPVRIEVAEQGRGARITHSYEVDSVAAESLHEGVWCGAEVSP